MGGYGYSLQSRKPKLELMKNAIVVAVVIAGLAMFFYNSSLTGGDFYGTYDDRIDEYPDHTFEDTCVMSVLLFAKVAFGVVFGIWVAFAMRMNATKDEI